MIRNAELRDLPAMVAMGRRFYEASGYSDITEFEEESFASTLKNAHGSVLLVAEKDGLLVGMVGALVYPLYFNVKHRTAQEMFWWVEPEHRGVGSELFDALISAVKAMGAESLSMIAIESAAWVGGYYEKRGFRPSERSFIRRL